MVDTTRVAKTLSFLKTQDALLSFLLVEQQPQAWWIGQSDTWITELVAIPIFSKGLCNSAATMEGIVPVTQKLTSSKLSELAKLSALHPGSVFALLTANRICLLPLWGRIRNKNCPGDWRNPRTKHLTVRKSSVIRIMKAGRRPSGCKQSVITTLKASSKKGLKTGALDFDSNNNVVC